MRKLLPSGLFVADVLQGGNFKRIGILHLQEENTKMCLVLRIGMLEMNSIASELRGAKFDRPQTHDLCVSLIKELNASVDYVVINDLQNDIYYAKIILRVGQEVKELDARPSDAIAIAMRSNVDIFVEESVFEMAAVTEKKALEKLQGRSESSQTPPATDQELEGLEPFRRVIEGIEGLDSLGSDGPDDLQSA